MAEPSSLHHWINTAIAAIAVVVSGVSLYYANEASNSAEKQAAKANKLAEEQAAKDREDIGVSARITLKCPFHFSMDQPAELGLCGKITLWNRSVQTSVIKDMNVQYVENGDPTHTENFITPTILSLSISRTDKSPLEKRPPITPVFDISGRNHAQMLIEAMIPVPPIIADTASAFIREHPNNPTLDQFSDYLHTKNEDVDIFGDKWTAQNPNLNIQITVVTSLDKSFGAELILPTDTGNFTQDWNFHGGG